MNYVKLFQNLSIVHIQCQFIEIQYIKLSIMDHHMKIPFENLIYKTTFHILYMFYYNIFTFETQ